VKGYLNIALGFLEALSLEFYFFVDFVRRLLGLKFVLQTNSAFFLGLRRRRPQSQGEGVVLAAD
jgi:hypothetical protein